MTIHEITAIRDGVCALWQSLAKGSAPNTLPEEKITPDILAHLTTIEARLTDPDPRLAALAQWDEACGRKP